MLLESRTTVRLGDSAHYLRELAEHLAEHEIAVTYEDRRAWLRAPMGTAMLEARSGELDMQVQAAEPEALSSVMYLLASHLGPMAREENPEILWSGDGDALPAMPEFRRMTVRNVRQITPRMRRLTLAGASLKRFATLRALHAKLLLPTGAAPAHWPRLGANGLIDWGPETTRPAIRKYTIRRVDADAGEMDIDFVLHADGGPGSLFADTARPGDELGLLGPGGGSAPVADWNLFAGDETALPAIARLIEALPASARAHAIIEVAGPEEEQPIAAPANVTIEWLHRDNGASALADRIERLAWSEENDIFAWAGTEFGDFTRIRADWRKRRGLTKHQHLAVAYWRAGQAQH